MAYHIGRNEFDRLVEEALQKIPEGYRKRFGNLTILVEDYPAEEDISQSKVPRYELLGLFRGSPYRETESFFDVSAPMPDSIILYQKNIEAICDSRDRLLEEIRLTLLHEVGHYFGMSEEELKEY